MKLVYAAIVMQFSVHSTAFAQTKTTSKDSIALKIQIEGFYRWYIDLIDKRKVNSEFNPTFEKRSDGMTMLNFTNYRKGMRKYRFSEDFILRKTNEYKECLDNLSKIPFDRFSHFTDLDDFESINCDFSNRYQWIGGQEQKGKATLSTLKQVNDNTVVGHISFTTEGHSDGAAVVTFRKVRGEWWIDDLVLRR